MALEQLEGKRIIHDNNKTYYIDLYTKKTYLIRKKDEKNYRLFEMRYLLVLGLMMAVLALSGNLSIAVIAGGILLIVAEICFYFLFLKELIQVDISFHKENLSDQVAEAFSKGMIVALIAILLILSAIFVFLAMHTVYEIMFMIFVGIACVFFYLAIIYIFGLIKKVRE